jgi:hypothetical protein
MMKPRGSQLLQQLPAQARAQILAAGREMAKLALDYAIPIIFAPPVGIAGKINGATGFGLRLDSGVFIGTAHHVLYDKGGYVDRIESGERLNWQVGHLRPFDPLLRVAWKDESLDIVLLEVSEEEAAAIGPCIVSSPPKWPPDLPKNGELVLIAGYPKALREEDRSSGIIGAGPLAAVFRITKVDEWYCSCVVERKDLVSFDGPLPELGTEIGGMSGAPVLRVGMLSYPLVGVVSGSFKMDDELEILRFANLKSVAI